MIGLIQNETIYEYDIRSLILAFMIGEKIELTNHVDSIYDFVLEVFYEKEKVWLKLYQKGEFLQEETLTGNYQEKRTFKNKMKRGIYRLFSEVLRKELPWGTLTGIRPTKIVFDGFAKGKPREQIIEDMQRDYLTSKGKAILCTEVVEKERDLLRRFPYQNGYSLYIGIPFCPSTCLYCSFASYPIGAYQKQVKSYLKALMKEAAFVRDRYQGKKLETLYIGGGTPTALAKDDLEILLDGINQYFPFETIREVTVEAGRPDSLDQEKLKVLSKYGVTRISINPQTMNDRTLQRIGRNHTAQDVREKFYLAREAGFDNINMDTICGLPEEGMKELEQTYRAIEELAPESLTVHALAIKRTSKFQQVKEHYHRYGATPEMIDYAIGRAGDMGLEPYYLYRQKNIPGNLENIGFSKKSKECFYNILIMEELHDIIAIGAGTSSKIMDRGIGSIARVENLKDVFQYIARIDEMIHRKEEKMNVK